MLFYLILETCVLIGVCLWICDFINDDKLWNELG
jgi:hypothetical protein